MVSQTPTKPMKSWAWWHTPVILATQEDRSINRRIEVQAGHGIKVSKSKNG
jgi:hypothetical protein